MIDMSATCGAGRDAHIGGIVNAVHHIASPDEFAAMDGRTLEWISLLLAEVDELRSLGAETAYLEGRCDELEAENASLKASLKAIANVTATAASKEGN